MLNIRESSPDSVPKSLLIIGDPSEERIAGYLAGSKTLIAEYQGEIVGALVLRMIDAAKAEVMNISVLAAHRRRRIGTALMDSAFALARDFGFRQVTVGTGNSSIGPLRFYQRQGFRICSVSKDYFKDDDPPIFEDGIRCLDMIHLIRDL